MHELRILSGLHRGATLPLDEHPHVIGAGDDDDVVLVDPGIEAQHATLSRSDSGWLLSATNGDVCGPDSNQPQTLVDLPPGGFARLGKVWISVAEQDAPWEDPPPEPVDFPLLDSDEFAIDDAESASADEEPDRGGADESAGIAKRHGRQRRMIYVPLALATVLSAAAAYAFTSKPAASPEKIDIQADIKVGSKGRLDKAPGDAITGTGKRGSNQAAETERPLTPAELRDAFRKRLADADLLKRFDLTLNDHAWTMQAALDDEETRRFERILATFISTHRITFPVHAKVGSGELMLPFKIRQVISGANANIVTQDGDRLYVGDEYLGVRVVAIQGNHLTFAGKRKIEVNW